MSKNSVKNEKSETSMTDFFVDTIIKFMEEQPDCPADFFDRVADFVLEGSTTRGRKDPEFVIPDIYKVCTCW